MTTSFDIEALRAVVAGIEQGSFARAAMELGRSQSAVSMQLKKLEQQAGTPLFTRRGRGLVPTDAGQALANYARRMIALNDEAARAVGATVAPETIRLGLPQDFFEDVMPATLSAFSQCKPEAHVTVRAGNNHLLGAEISSGRLDAAIAFFPKHSGSGGQLLGELPVHWLAHRRFGDLKTDDVLPLVLFDHPCLFRLSALAVLDQSNRRWKAALTTPSLPAVWSALRAGFGFGVRVGHALPDDIISVGDRFRLSTLPAVELRLLGAPDKSPAVEELMSILKTTTLNAIEDDEASPDGISA